MGTAFQLLDGLFRITVSGAVVLICEVSVIGELDATCVTITWVSEKKQQVE